MLAGYITGLDGMLKLYKQGGNLQGTLQAQTEIKLAEETPETLLADVPYPVEMDPKLVVEFYSSH